MPAALFVALAGTALHRHDWSWSPASTSRGAPSPRCVLLGSVQLWLGAAFRSVAPDGGLRRPLLRADRLVVHPGSGQAPGHRRRRGQYLGLRHRRHHRGHARLVPALQAGQARTGRHPRDMPILRPPSRDMPTRSATRDMSSSLGRATRPRRGHAHFSIARAGTMALCPAPGLGARDMPRPRRVVTMSADRPRARPVQLFHIAQDPTSGRSVRLHHGCMANIIEVLSNYDGVARAKYIAAAGVSDFQLKSAMASGTVSRVARGVYALPGADAAADRHPLASGGTGVHHRGALQRAVGP